MASIFISYASQDADAAEALHDQLKTWGFASIFLARHHEDGVPTGRDWEHQIYAELRATDALVLLGSPHAVASRWCFAEIAIARASRKPVFPVWLGGERPQGLLDDLQWLEVTERPEGHERLRSALIAHFDLRAGFTWDPRRPPYPGLRPFQAEDAAVFFGRDQKTAEFMRRLQPGGGPARSVAAIGASGTGKSSLVRAGVVPILRRARDTWVVIPPFTPGQHPVASLARALCSALQEAKLPADRQLVHERLLCHPQGLAELVLDLAGTGQEPREVVLVVDQAEELVALAAEADATVS